MGNPLFFGPGLTVDTTKPFTVVTQFLTNDNTTTGTLLEIRRFYIQNGKVILNPTPSIPGIPIYNSITEDYCSVETAIFNSSSVFETDGGLSQISQALQKGLVLAFSIQDDHATNMQWLDSDYPPNLPADQPGVARGTCPPTYSGGGIIIEPIPNYQVRFSNIKVGDIGSTYGNPITSTPSSTAPTSTSSNPSSTTSGSQPTQTKYGQW